MGKQTGAGQGLNTDKKLDQALEDSFPASDPPAAGPRGITGAEAAPKAPAPTATEAECEAESDALDEALAESFPASDPPAQNVKRGADDAAPEDLCPPAPVTR